MHFGSVDVSDYEFAFAVKAMSPVGRVFFGTVVCDDAIVKDQYLAYFMFSEAGQQSIEVEGVYDVAN